MTQQSALSHSSFATQKNKRSVTLAKAECNILFLQELVYRTHRESNILFVSSSLFKKKRGGGRTVKSQHNIFIKADEKRNDVASC